MTDQPTAQSQPLHNVYDPQAHQSGQPNVLADEGRPSSVLSQALPQAVIQQADDTLNPAHPTVSTTKESGPALKVDQVVELPHGVQSVEALLSPEIPVEVEKFISEVKDHSDEIPQEVVIADQATMPQVLPKTMSKPVIVLPMSEADLDRSHKEPVTSSKRWLGEWLEKVIKLFNGEVVFRNDK